MFVEPFSTKLGINKRIGRENKKNVNGTKISQEKFMGIFTLHFHNPNRSFGKFLGPLVVFVGKKINYFENHLTI